MKKLIRWIAAVAFLPLFAFAFTHNPPEKKHPEGDIEKEVEGAWSRHLLRSMTLDEKIGQLFMVAAYSNKDEAHYKQIDYLVEKLHIGGLIFMQGGPKRQIKLINRYQNKARIPLLMAQDSEWGLSMRLDSTLSFPRNMTLGAIREDTLIFRMGEELGRQCRRVGIQVNFAPVVDVNNNPANPVINDRSFGEMRDNVARKGIQLMAGMYSASVLACAKHFPGHGDTGTDSHLDLPVIRHNRARLDSIELYPFRQLIEAGVPSVMIAHLYVPALDSTPNQPSTLSKKIVTDMLKKEMGFRGLIFTDALNMKGVTKFYKPGEVDVKALLAGNDILLFSQDVSTAVAQIKEALEKGEITPEELDQRVLKILLAKEWAGLNVQKTIEQLTSYDDITNLEGLILRKQLYESAITLARNDSNLIPIGSLAQRKVAQVQIGGTDHGPFYQTVKKYGPLDYYYLPSVSDAGQRKAVLQALQKSTTVLVTVEGMNKYAGRNFGVSVATVDFMHELNKTQKEVVLTLFGNPYSLKNFGPETAVIVAYEDAPEAQVAAAEVIFGGLVPSGQLPVTASDFFRAGQGRLGRFPERFAFAWPEEAGMKGQELARIDAIAKDAISKGATPGCAILVMRGNKIVYDKAFGNTVYKNGTPIDPYNSMYDLASVTKVTATTLATMRLVEEGKINLDEKVSAYLPDLAESNKSKIKVRNLLTHNAGLKAWIPFYMDTYAKDNKLKLDTAIYSNKKDERFCVPILDGLYMCVDYQDSIWGKIINSGVGSEQRVVYSDLGLIIMGRIIEKVSGTSLDHYVDSVFYQPMGLNNTCFNPGLKGLGKRCVPTELDQAWRGGEVQGFVHDQASAMLGGVCGHAGLFSNVYDLAKLFYMVNNRGEYGGMKFFDQKTITDFTARQYKNSRKGLGWDKPDTDSKDGTPCSQYSSELTFGHTGFTGIGAWCDPKEDIVMIFLSNRTYPDANNKKLLGMNVRSNIMDVIYESIYAFENPDWGVK
ncbi:MAG: serine hydrolase [Bacteroidia bacterium]|nr:serine hydrolase [Bacteroidia bacterium]